MEKYKVLRYSKVDIKKRPVVVKTGLSLTAALRHVESQKFSDETFDAFTLEDERK